jgi:hypothetical protein
MTMRVCGGLPAPSRSPPPPVSVDPYISTKRKPHARGIAPASHEKGAPEDTPAAPMGQSTTFRAAASHNVGKATSRSSSRDSDPIEAMLRARVHDGNA